MLPGVKYELMDMTEHQYSLVLGDTDATYHYITSSGDKPEKPEEQAESEAVERSSYQSACSETEAMVPHAETEAMVPQAETEAMVPQAEHCSAISHMSFDKQPQR